MKTAVQLIIGLLVATAPGLAAEELAEVQFALGPMHFSGGDEIVIERVLATSPNLGAGDKVTVRGRYSLASHEKARLCLYLTTEISAGPEPESPAQVAEVKRGSGTFELTKTMKNPGHLHLSFYGGSRGG